MSTVWLDSFSLFLFRERLEGDLQKLGEEVEQSHEDAQRGGTSYEDLQPANKNVPRLESYEEDLGDAYWEKGRCQEWLGVHEGWGFLSTLGTLKTPLRRSVGVKRA